MKRFGSLAAVLVILMAGFMSVCVADANCTPEATHAAVHSANDLHASKAPTKDAKQDHCGMVCHVAPHTVLQTLAGTVNVLGLAQERILSADDTLRLGLYTVLDQPPRA